MADNDSSGAQPNPTPYWVADFNGDAKDELLFYVPEDDNWRLGAYDGTQLQWSLAGDTANFGHAINDGRPFWAGDFNGDQKVEVLFYYPGDNNWWLGVYNGNQFAWSQAGNTATLEQPGNEGPLFWIGAFSAATRLDVLYYDPDVDKWWLGTYSGNAFAWSDAGYRPTAEQGMTKRWATQPTAVNALITAFAPRVWLYPPRPGI
jgi:hypothetical protein